MIGFLARILRLWNNNDTLDNVMLYCSGTAIKIKAKNVPAFSAGKVLKDAVK